MKKPLIAMPFKKMENVPAFFRADADSFEEVTLVENSPAWALIKRVKDGKETKVRVPRGLVYIEVAE